MLKIILIILAILYVVKILSVINKIFQTTSCIRKLQKFLSSTSPSGYSLSGNHYQRYLNRVLRIYPRICKLYPWSSSQLSYGKTDRENYFASRDLCNQLCMKRNFLVQELIDSLNPVSVFKFLLSFPSALLGSIGINTKPSSKKLLNLIGWIIAFLLDAYKPEIKSVINYLLSFL